MEFQIIKSEGVAAGPVESGLAAKGRETDRKAGWKRMFPAATCFQ